MLACLLPPTTVSISAQHLSGGDDFGVQKQRKEVPKKGHTKAPYAVCEKKRCTSCDTRAHKCPYMLHLVLARIASNIPKPPSQMLSFSLSLRLQIALRARIRILKNRLLEEGVKVVYQGVETVSSRSSSLQLCNGGKQREMFAAAVVRPGFCTIISASSVVG